MSSRRANPGAVLALAQIGRTASESHAPLRGGSIQEPSLWLPPVALRVPQEQPPATRWGPAGRKGENASAWESGSAAVALKQVEHLFGLEFGGVAGLQFR